MLTSSQYSTHSVRAIKLLYFLLYVGMAAWSTQFYAFLERERSLSGVQIGAIAAVQQINNLIILPFWGMISDRYGKRRVFLILLAVSALCIEGFLYTGGFIYYLLFIVVFTTLYNPLAALVDSFALEKTSIPFVRSSYGNMRLWASLGWSVSSIGTGMLIRYAGFSFSVIFPITTVFFLVAWIVAYISLNKKHEYKTSKSPSFKTLRDLLMTDRRIVLFFLFCLTYYIFNSPILNMINIYYSEICVSYFSNLSAEELNVKIGLIVGIAFAVQSIFELPFMFFANFFIKRYGTRNVILFTMFVAFLRMMLYGLSTNPWFSVVIGATHGITLGLFWVAAVGYVHTLIPKSQNSTGQMLFNTFLAIGTCIGNLLTGFMKDTISIQNGMMVNATVILGIILAGIFFTRRQARLA